MSVGLDLGTTEFRSIRDSGGDLVARRCRACYLVVKDTPGHRRLLEHTQAQYGTCGDDLVIFGDDALDCAAMLDVPAVPLLRDGRLPAADPVARQILALMVEAVLPASQPGGSVCCLALPGGYGLDGDTQSLDVRFLQQLVSLRGYKPQLISSGLAVVLAELSSASFSGFGISLGMTNCEIGLVHCGRELARCTIPSPFGELANEISGDVKPGSGVTTVDSRQLGWDRNCLRMLTSILSEAREVLVAEGSIRLIPQPTGIACSGWIASTEGFADLFQSAWSQAGWPLKTSPVRVPKNPRFAVAYGALIKAILDGRAVPERCVA